MLTIALILYINGFKFSPFKGLTVLFSGLSQTLRGIFVGPRSFSYFSAQGSEKGGEAGPTQKATLFPSGSVLHPTMNGVLKNITLGLDYFSSLITEPFVPEFRVVCSYSLQMRQPWFLSTVPVLKSPPPNWMYNDFSLGLWPSALHL